MILLSESDVTRGLSHTSRHLDPEGTGTRVLWSRWEGVQVGIDPPTAWHSLCLWGHWSAGSASCPFPHRGYLRSARSPRGASDATLVVAPDRPLRQPDPCAFPATRAVHGFCCWSCRRSEWAPWGLRGGCCSRGNQGGVGGLEGGALPGEAVRFEASRKWPVPGGGATGSGRREEVSLETTGQAAQSPGGAGWGQLCSRGSAWRLRGGQRWGCRGWVVSPPGQGEAGNHTHGEGWDERLQERVDGGDLPG